MFHELNLVISDALALVIRYFSVASSTSGKLFAVRSLEKSLGAYGIVPPKLHPEAQLWTVFFSVARANSV